MSKNYRGKGIIDKPARGRGTCPVCKRTGVKILHEKEIEGKKTLVCKICSVVLSRKPAPAKAEAKPEESKKEEAAATASQA